MITEHSPAWWRALEDFVLARIAEDEVTARAASAIVGDGEWLSGTGVVKSATLVQVSETPVDQYVARHDPARVLAECEAKRQIVEHAGNADDWTLLTLLALPYADHRDYDEAWRP